VSDSRRSGSGTAGGWQLGSLTPHIILLSHPRGCGGGEERRLDHPHRAFRNRGSSMTCHATPPLKLFAAGACFGASRSVDRGRLLPRLWSPLSDASQRKCRCQDKL